MLPADGGLLPFGGGGGAAGANSKEQQAAAAAATGEGDAGEGLGGRVREGGRGGGRLASQRVTEEEGLTCMTDWLVVVVALLGLVAGGPEAGAEPGGGWVIR